MDRLYVFLIRNDVWIYILSVMGLLWFLGEFLRSRAAAQRAMFGLERETALRTRNSALLLVLIFISIIAVVVYVNREIAPTLPPSLLKPPTPTPNPLSLPPVEAETARPSDAGPSPTSPIAPTVTLPGAAAPLTTTVTVTTTAPAITVTVERPTRSPEISGCSPVANISDPQPGTAVAGILNLFGTADTPDFGYYELEISGPQTNGRWASLLGRRITQPVDDGFLGGNINLSQWTAGTYLIRLTVANETGDITHQCSVSIVLNTQTQ